MAYKKLTETGENFIKEIAKRLTSTQGSTSMIKGKNSYNLPFSDKSNEVITWVCNIPNVTTNGLTIRQNYARCSLIQVIP